MSLYLLVKKINSIHQFILKIKQILEFHDLKNNPHFDHVHPKSFSSTFDFHEFVPKNKK